MNKDDTRKFQINISLKLRCNLQVTKRDLYQVEVLIRKTELNQEEGWKFQMADNEDEVYLECKPGYYQLNIDRPELDCGVAQILIQLCLNENVIHDVDNQENQAMLMIERYHLNNEVWVESNCDKIVYTENLIEPLNMAYLYIKAAMLSHYEFSFILLSNLNIYPPKGKILTNRLLIRYDGMGGMVKYDEVENVEGTEWFFCKKKSRDE